MHWKPSKKIIQTYYFKKKIWGMYFNVCALTIYKLNLV